LKIKAVEKAENQLMETILSGGLNNDLLDLANQKATQLKRDKQILYDKIDEYQYKQEDSGVIAEFAKSWKKADYSRKKSVAEIMINKILISEDGNIEIIWNI